MRVLDGMVYYTTCFNTYTCSGASIWCIYIQNICKIMLKSHAQLVCREIDDRIGDESSSGTKEHDKHHKSIIIPTNHPPQKLRDSCLFIKNDRDDDEGHGD